MENNLEEFRRKKALNQATLASILNVSRQTISSIENGRYNPSLVLAFKIAKYFHVSIEDVFIYKEEDYHE